MEIMELNLQLNVPIIKVEIKGDGILSKRYFYIAFLIAIILSFIQITPASAAPNLEVKMDVGVNNKVKYSTPLPLNITVTNSGSAFSGDLVIDAAESYALGSGLVYPVDIAEGETKTIQLYLNGLSDDYMYSNNQQYRLVYFYEGGLEKGKLIDYKGSANARPQYYEPEATFIYTLTENSDRLSALLRLGQNTPQGYEVFHLNQLKNFEYPTDSKGFEMADILAVDEESITDLPQDVQQAIYDWVEQGGTLLVGASDQLSASMGIFQQRLPLKLLNERQSVSADSLKTLTGGGIFTQNIDVYHAEEKEGSKRLVTAGDTLLAASSTVGKGMIIQTTFSLGDQPLASMDGYSKLLTQLLNTHSQTKSNSATNYIGNYADYLPYEVGSVNELFPSFEVSPTALIIIVIVYILFIGPILYFILKRLDKREHAWWIIPVISVALSLCMFILGAKDRLVQSQIQQSAFYEVNTDGSLTGHYVETILSNRSGDFTFTTDKNTTAVATRNIGGMGGPTTERLHEKSYVEQHASGSSITLQNLKYWSVQSVVGETVIPNAGKMDISLTLKDGKLEGAIKNNFPFKLKDVAIWSGSREYEFGDIEANETLQVSRDLNTSLLLSPTISNYAYTYPQTKGELLPARLEKLKYGAGGLIDGERLPAVIAWADEALVGIELDGSADVSPVSFMIQTFEPKVEFSGEFKLNQDTLEETLEPKTQYGYMDLINPATNEWYLDQGEYDYYVSMPMELNDSVSNWTEIIISNKASNSMKLSIWNVKTSQYEEITENKHAIKENVGNYLSPDGQVRILVDFKDNGLGLPVIMPGVEIKGVAK
ncbi:hypothetical protein [Lysinibacillus composti]|uniref:hypothetical protein n=1 Tax=Lysinibacillus composti TaxID=720633 RepID=UPI00196008BD|nr:hypothetical protein [Lysinibacillus composti]